MRGALLAAGGAAGASYLLQRRRRRTLGSATLASRIATHPFTFGAAAGLANGVLAAARNKPVSMLAHVVTVLVIGISEGILVYDPARGRGANEAAYVAGLSALGATAGLAPFTRWDAHTRAWLERQTAPAPLPR